MWLMDKGFLDKRFVKRCGVLHSFTGDEMRLFDEQEAEVLRLSPVAGFIWDSLSPKSSIYDIIKKVSFEFCAPEKQALGDVKLFLRELISLGLVEECKPADRIKRLAEIYSHIPESACSCCGACCTNTVIYSVEFENISSLAGKIYGPDDLKKIEAQVALNIATQAIEMARVSAENIEAMEPLERCVFFDKVSLRCGIYAQRPFACRVFGLEKNRPCNCGSLNLKDQSISMEYLQEKFNVLRSDLEDISLNYEEKETGRLFNKAELNTWLYFNKSFVCKGD